MRQLKPMIASYIGTLFFAAFLFISAWKVNYWQGLLFLTLSLIGTTLNHLLLPQESTLIEERMNQAQEGVEWDKNLLKLYFLISLMAFIIAGLDSGRFLWSGQLPFWVNLVGALTTLLGQLIFAFAKRENAFFSSTVRIQSEKNQTVCSTGLYKRVRHPGYLGMALSMTSFPFVLGSFYSAIPALLCVMVLIIRTNLEDTYLKQNLEGYLAYAQAVKWKWLPFLY